MIKVIKSIKFSHEKNGFFELDNCTLSRIVNETGKNIIVDINEGLNIDEIVDKYSNEVTKKDIYMFLSDLRKLNYIDFDDSFFSELFINYSVKITGEKEAKSVCEFIQDDNNSVIYPENLNKSLYNILSMRMRSFSNKETIFYKENNNSIIAVIATKGFNVVNCPVVITLISVRKGEMNSLVSFYKDFEKLCIKKGKYKIKILFKTQEVSEQIKTFMKETGFCFEAELMCEDGKSNTVIYSRILS